MLRSILHFLFAYDKCGCLSDLPIAKSDAIALRAEVAQLREERAGFFEEIADKDDRIRALEDEVDDLRMLLGLAEAPQ